MTLMPEINRNVFRDYMETGWRDLAIPMKTQGIVQSGPSGR